VPVWHRFFYLDVMKILHTTFLFFCLTVPTLSHAVSFTADAVQIRGESVSHAKMFWLDGNVRFEYIEDGIPMAQIFDNKNNKIIWLDNENKYYVEREMPENEKVIAGNKSKKNDDPCKQFVGAECVFLKKTKMNGRAAEKWLITINDNGHDFHIFQWIDSKYKNILRQENSDGTGLSVYIKDEQKMNGRKVRKLTMVAFSSSGEQEQGTQWYDNELDIVVKQEYQSDVVDELRNITVGKVSKKLFSIPKDYVLFDSALNTAQKQADNITVEVAGKN
jgi:hypothetical protein